MRGIKWWAVGLAVVATTALPGCYTMDMDVARIYGDPAPGSPSIGTFRTERKCHALIFGIFSLGSPEVKAVIDEEVRNLGGRTARNVKIRHQLDFIDGFLRGITWGIYSPTTVSIEGEVVK